MAVGWRVPTASQAIVLFDGECAFCTRLMGFVRQRDRCSSFRFIALQSAEGRSLLVLHQLPIDRLDSVVLIESGAVSLRSTAILRICRRLGGAWRLLYAGIFLPGCFRDRLYVAIARRRRLA